MIQAPGRLSGHLNKKAFGFSSAQVRDLKLSNIGMLRPKSPYNRSLQARTTFITCQTSNSSKSGLRLRNGQSEAKN
jgi:hypothetical protein